MTPAPKRPARTMMDVLGQIEGLSTSDLEVWREREFICLKLTGDDGTAYGTLTPAQAERLARALAELAGEAVTFGE